jgi:uncharacterized membrane protein YgcG
VLFLGHRALRLWRLRTRAGEQLFREAGRMRRSLTGSERPGPDDPTGEALGRLFPYALAIDAVEAWESRMTRHDLDAGAPSPGFRWLRRDPSWDRDRYLARPFSSITDELTSMITTTAAPPPGSSSGGSSSSSSSGSSSSSSSSDSGGSSGGGGGGGGGGGW